MSSNYNLYLVLWQLDSLKCTWLCGRLCLTVFTLGRGDFSWQETNEILILHLQPLMNHPALSRTISVPCGAGTSQWTDQFRQQILVATKTSPQRLFSHICCQLPGTNTGSSSWASRLKGFANYTNWIIESGSVGVSE